jgi:hypothetical protein
VTVTVTLSSEKDSFLLVSRHIPISSVTAVRCLEGMVWRDEAEFERGYAKKSHRDAMLVGEADPTAASRVGKKGGEVYCTRRVN